MSHPLPTYAGGHLGALVSPLVDGQLRPATAERAWAHVLRCHLCTESVRRQTWVKNQLLLTRSAPPPASLTDRLCARPDRLAGGPAEPAETVLATSTPRTRAAALAGVGGLSAAAFVVASLVGLPAVGGTTPVEARLPAPTATSGGPGAAIVDAITIDRQRRVGLP
jgi:hypothetical protein